MLHLNSTTFRSWWQTRLRRHTDADSPTAPLERPNLSQLAKLDESELPGFVRECGVAMRYLRLLVDLDWDNFPERDPHRAWPGPKPAPRAPFVAAFLVKIEEGKRYMSDLRNFLVEHPALVWVLGFPLTPSVENRWGFDADASLPTRKHMSRVLREMGNHRAQFLFGCTVKLLDAALPDEVDFGNEISLDTKHVIAWVAENNLNQRIPDRYVKDKQPTGDPDCKLGFKARNNKRSGKKRSDKPEQSPSQDTSQQKRLIRPTPTKEGIPASKQQIGQFYWGYASGVVATKVKELGEFVLAELTQTFDQSDQSYFDPLMEQTERHLGRKPPYGALDAAYDWFHVHEYFHDAGGFAAVPWAGRKDHHKQFDGDGLPFCQAGLAMPLCSTYQKRSHCLVPHQCGRYLCPLLHPEPNGDACPIDHDKWDNGGCMTVLPTSIGTRLRHQLDRESDEYKRIYRQRTATERINSQAKELGIERPKLRNRHSIANQNTLIYVLINLHALQKVRSRTAEQGTSS